MIIKLDVGNWLTLVGKTKYASNVIQTKGDTWKILEFCKVEDRKAIVLARGLQTEVFRGQPPIFQASTSPTDRLTVFFNDDNFQILKKD